MPRARARQDVEEAVSHLVTDAGSAVALGFVDALERAYRHIARQPATGSPRWAQTLDLPGLRTWPLSRHPYLVCYLERADHIDVWRVLHMQRDVPASLSRAETDPPDR